jgi:hypothetical protein
MKKLRIGIVDLVSRGPTRALFARVMNANLASIMPQVIGVWCRQEGHDVSLICYTGFENLRAELPDDADLVFIGCFTESAHVAYALSDFYRARGAVTAVGGPHARCYPEDCHRFFDYVLGFTDRATIRDILEERAPHRPVGLHKSALRQPLSLPGVRERWPFIEATLAKAPFLKIVPMLGSLGCPYTCSFCIDAEIPYQPLDFDVLKDDLRFLLKKLRRPRVAWHDPNFGVRFEDYMNAIEETVPPDRIDFIAESSLSVLTEAHVKRLERNGFKALLPGIESWYDLGNKSRTGAKRGLDKVRQVADQVNMILRHVPYIQTNFVLGLDSDEGAEPFELTKRFLDLAPGAFPGFSLLSAFGQAAPLNLEYQRARRVLPFPFHFLNNNQAMNIRPRNYRWPAFYQHVIDLTRYAFSGRTMWKRFWGTERTIPRWMNLVRAVSAEGFGRLRYYREISRRLETDRQFAPFFEQQTTKLPQFYLDMIRKDLGPWWRWLPPGALEHDSNAYLKKELSRSACSEFMPSGLAMAAS